MLKSLSMVSKFPSTLTRQKTQDKADKAAVSAAMSIALRYSNGTKRVKKTQRQTDKESSLIGTKTSKASLRPTGQIDFDLNESIQKPDIFAGNTEGEEASKSGKYRLYGK